MGQTLRYVYAAADRRHGGSCCSCAPGFCHSCSATPTPARSASASCCWWPTCRWRCARSSSTGCPGPATGARASWRKALALVSFAAARLAARRDAGSARHPDRPADRQRRLPGLPPPFPTASAGALAAGVLGPAPDHRPAGLVAWSLSDDGRLTMPRPSFFLVGAPKCGTTSLCHYLGQHPDIFIPRLKELNFFASDLHLHRHYASDRDTWMRSKTRWERRHAAKALCGTCTLRRQHPRSKAFNHRCKNNHKFAKSDRSHVLALSDTISILDGKTPSISLRRWNNNERDIDRAPIIMHTEEREGADLHVVPDVRTQQVARYLDVFVTGTSRLSCSMI